MHILRVCKDNGYSVTGLDYLFNNSPFCHFSLTLSGFGVLRLIENTLVKLIGYWARTFDLGIFNRKHRSNRLLKTGEASENYCVYVSRIPCSIFSPHLKARFYAVGRILTRSHVLMRKSLGPLPTLVWNKWRALICQHFCLAFSSSEEWLHNPPVKAVNKYYF